jgi:hypothetical protein
VPGKCHIVLRGTHAENGASQPKLFGKKLDDYETIRTILLRLFQAMCVVSKCESKSWSLFQMVAARHYRGQENTYGMGAGYRGHQNNKIMHFVMRFPIN